MDSREKQEGAGKDATLNSIEIIVGLKPTFLRDLRQ
jgi:hypothetical protein